MALLLSVKYRSLEEMGERQHQLVTKAQLEKKFSSAEIRTMRTNGVIVREAPSVFRVLGGPETYEQRVHVALLDDPGAQASFRTAARLWNLLPTNQIEVTTSITGSARMRGVKVHRSRALERSQVVDFMYLTNPARTLADIAPKVSTSSLERALQQALRQELVTFSTIRNELELLRTPARKGVGILERLLNSFDSLDESSASDFEKEVLKEFRRRLMPLPVREFRVEVEGVNRYIDLAYPEHRIAVEVDSRSYHALLLSFDNDRARNSGISALGFAVLQITRRNFSSDIDRVERLLRERRRNAA